MYVYNMIIFSSYLTLITRRRFSKMRRKGKRTTNTVPHHSSRALILMLGLIILLELVPLDSGEAFADFQAASVVLVVVLETICFQSFLALLAEVEADHPDFLKMYEAKT